MALKRAASLAMLVVLPVPLTPTTRMTAGWAESGRGGSQSAAARATRRSRSSAWTAATGEASERRLAAADDVDGQPCSKVGRDEGLLDLLPVRLVDVGPEDRAQARHEPSARPQAGRDGRRF